MKSARGVVAVLALGLAACALASSEHYDDGVCPEGRKACGRRCVAVVDPDYGCASATCDPCDLSKASATCVAGACAIAQCYPGRESCNRDPQDGCETDLANDPASCGACGAACRVENATAGCTRTVCSIALCNDGFANCNGKVVDGCETDLSNRSSCGACGEMCEAAEECVVRPVAGVWSAKCEVP